MAVVFVKQPSRCLVTRADFRIDFAGKVAVVTGGASGIGLATCVAFAKLGCKVVVNDYSEDSKGKAIAHILEASQCAADALLFVQGDVSKEGDVVGLIEKAVAAFGKLDILVNNAGISHTPLPFEDISSEDFGNVMHVSAVVVVQRAYMPPATVCFPQYWAYLCSCAWP